MAAAELPVAEQVRPLDLIAYQQGAVVSRTLLKRSAGTVTLFAFDQGQGLSEHTAPFDGLVHVLDGDAEITIAGQAHQLSAGEMILMPAHQPHALTARTAFTMLLTMIRSA
jgi:quercetin dioxygenase-like cupin family protein